MTEEASLEQSEDGFLPLASRLSPAFVRGEAALWGIRAAAP